MFNNKQSAKRFVRLHISFPFHPWRGDPASGLLRKANWEGFGDNVIKDDWWISFVNTLSSFDKKGEMEYLQMTFTSQQKYNKYLKYLEKFEPVVSAKAHNPNSGNKVFTVNVPIKNIRESVLKNGSNVSNQYIGMVSNDGFSVVGQYPSIKRLVEGTGAYGLVSILDVQYSVLVAAIRNKSHAEYCRRIYKNFTEAFELFKKSHEFLEKCEETKVINEMEWNEYLNQVS